MPGSEFYLDAFWELSTERQIGMGYGPIPHSAIRDYCVQDTDELSIFLAVIRAMDREWLTHANSDETQPQESAEPLSPSLFKSMFS